MSQGSLPKLTVNRTETKKNSVVQLQRDDPQPKQNTPLPTFQIQRLFGCILGIEVSSINFPIGSPWESSPKLSPTEH